MDRCFEYGRQEALKSNKKLVCSIVVDSDNPPARKLYEKCGFVTLSEEAMSQTDRIAVLMKYA